MEKVSVDQLWSVFVPEDWPPLQRTSRNTCPKMSGKNWAHSCDSGFYQLTDIFHLIAGSHANILERVDYAKQCGGEQPAAHIFPMGCRWETDGQRGGGVPSERCHYLKYQVASAGSERQAFRSVMWVKVVLPQDWIKKKKQKQKQTALILKVHKLLQQLSLCCSLPNKSEAPLLLFWVWFQKWCSLSRRGPSSLLPCAII